MRLASVEVLFIEKLHLLLYLVHCGLLLKPGGIVSGLYKSANELSGKDISYVKTFLSFFLL